MKNIPFLIIILLVLVSCSSFQEAGKILRNEKTNTTDEFLVKKELPIMPPDMNKVPEPESIKIKKKEEEKIKNFKIPNSSSSSNNSKSSTEIHTDKIRKDYKNYISQNTNKKK